MRRVNRGLAASAALLATGTTGALAQVTDAFDPRGIYHNAFDGGFSGTEWFQVIEIPATDRFRVADIFGGGFNATISDSGAVTLDGGVGAGAFIDDDSWVIEPTLGGTPFIFDNVRAPDTGPDFGLQLESPVAANPLLAGTWQSLTQGLDPRTGDIISGATETITIDVDGTTFRITDPGGAFFQGVVESPNDIRFRFLTPEPSDPRFQSFDGSDINFPQNMIGQVEIETINDFSAIFLLQSRDPLGSQDQLAFRFTATRVDPLPFGDVTGNRILNTADLTALNAQIGLVATDDDFNIAADLDGDDDVDADDAAILDDLLDFPCTVADLEEPFGIIDLTDLDAFIRAFLASEPAADFAFPFGVIDLTDIDTFMVVFLAGCP